MQIGSRAFLAALIAARVDAAQIYPVTKEKGGRCGPPFHSNCLFEKV